MSLTFVLNVVHSLDLLPENLQKTGPLGEWGADPSVLEHSDASPNVCVVFWRR